MIFALIVGIIYTLKRIKETTTIRSFTQGNKQQTKAQETTRQKRFLSNVFSDHIVKCVQKLQCGSSTVLLSHNFMMG